MFNGLYNVILMDNQYNLWIWGLNQNNICLVDKNNDNINNEYIEYDSIWTCYRIIKPLKIDRLYIFNKLGLIEIYNIQITCFGNYDEIYITGI